MTERHQERLFSRNAPFIDGNTQARLSEMHVGVVGCGLASQIALGLARLGIRRFRLWDFDAVEWSNLNRQAFLSEHIDVNKAAASAALLRCLDPSIVVEVNEDRFAVRHLGCGLPGLDLVVNSIDFDDALIYDVSDAMQRAGAWSIQPLNLGFGGSCVILGPTSPSLIDLTLGRQPNAASFVQNLLGSPVGFEPSEALAKLGADVLATGERSGWFPQNIVATLITTALVTWSVAQIAAGRGAKIQAPRLLHFEPKA